MALPQAFVERFGRVYPEKARQLLPLFDAPRPVSFRLNPLKADRQKTLEALRDEGFDLSPVAWYADAYTVPYAQRDALTRSKFFERGEIYIQSLSSMLAPLALDPKPDETVLDLAAAPGGKSLMMAALMQNRGWLSVVEPSKERFFRLKANLTRGGVTIARYYMTDGRSVGAKCPAMFDKVMLDAPCSTEAKFKSFDPKTVAYWSERKIKEMGKLQFRLLLSAYKSLKPGGTLLYATCSFAPEENEAVIDKALGRLENLEVLPLNLPVPNTRAGLSAWGKKRFDERVKHTVRILPNESMEGFYLALLRKTEETT